MHVRRLRYAMTATLLTAAVVLASCGTRLPHDAIVGAAGENGVIVDSGQAMAGDGSLPGTVGADGAAPSAVNGKASSGGSFNGSARAGSTTAKTGTGSGARTSAGKNKGKGRPAKGQPLVIGSVGTYSGPVGSSWKDAPRALRAWAADINANGGISGRPVKVIVMDDGGDASRSRSQVQELVERHKVVALVSAFVLTESAKAWRGYLEQKGVPAIGGGCALGWNDSPIMFNQCPSPDVLAYGLVHLAAKYGKGKKFGAMVCTEDVTCSYMNERWFAKGYAERAGLDPVYRATISLTQPDFTAECIQARNAGVELLTVVADTNTVHRVAASCRRQNFAPQFVELDTTISPDAPGKEGTSDVLVSSMTLPYAGLSSPAAAAFQNAWRRYAGGAPSAAASAAWAAAKVFEKAAREAGKNVTSAALLDRLYSYKNERFGGYTIPQTYVRGKGTAETPCVFVMKASGGRWSAPNGDKPLCF